MRKKRNFYPAEIEIDETLITEPDEAFTPRQILEQFARGELSVKEFEPTDSIDSLTYSDDQMMDAIEFEDDFEAAQFLMDSRIEKNESKKFNQKQDDVSTGSENTPTEGA